MYCIDVEVLAYMNGYMHVTLLLVPRCMCACVHACMRVFVRGYNCACVGCMCGHGHMCVLYLEKLWRGMRVANISRWAIGR